MYFSQHYILCENICTQWLVKSLFQALSEDADVIAKALRKSDSGLVEVKFCYLRHNYVAVS